MGSRTFLVVAVLATALAWAGWSISRAQGFQLFGEILTRIDTSEPMVALTFDDGPTQAHTPTQLEALASAGVHATFFLVGRDIDANPSAAAAIVAAGHEIGNHSYTHDRMMLRSQAWIQSQLDRTDAAIRALGYQGQIPFRPPFGKKLVVLPWVLAKEDRTTFMWSVDPMQDLGWDATAKDIQDHVIRHSGPGDIILLHGMFRANEATRQALPGILQGLTQKGLKVVPLGTLLEAGG